METYQGDSASNDSPLVSCQWLHSHLYDPGIQIFDCTASVDKHLHNSGYRQHYLHHHIPGAAYLDIGNGQGIFTNQQPNLPYAWPNLGNLSQACAHHGLNPNKLIVLYSGSNPADDSEDLGQSWATRAWWLLSSVDYHCKILDGGFKNWRLFGYPVSNNEDYYPPLTDLSLRQQGAWVADKYQVLEHLRQGRPLIDSLSQESFNGLVDRRYGRFGRRTGHITGAINVHYETLLNRANSCFKSKVALIKLFAQAGVNLSLPIITYCGGGIGATVTAFGLRVIGCQSVTIYDGSLMEWSNDPDLPMS